MRSSSLTNPRVPCGGATRARAPIVALRRLIVAARAAAADADLDGAADYARAPLPPSPSPPPPPPAPPSAYTSIAPLSAEARARDAAAARELAARTRATLAARLLSAAEQVAEADAAERRREQARRRRAPRRRPAEELPPPSPPPLSPEEAIQAAVPVVLERADPALVAWQRRRGGGAGEASERQQRNHQRRRQGEAELRRLVAPHLPAAVRLATAAALARAEEAPFYENEDDETEDQEEQQQPLLLPSSPPSPHGPRPPPPPAPTDPDALLAAVRASSLPSGSSTRIAVFKGGGYRYDDLEASIAQEGIGHVFRLTNLALKARCVLSTERWLSSGRRASLVQHRALAAARRIPVFVVPPGEPVDARALCLAARGLLVAKGVLAPGQGETRAGLEAAVEAAVPDAAVASKGRRRQGPVGFRGLPMGPKSGEG